MLGRFPEDSQSSAVAVGQNEDPLPTVRRADIGRTRTSPFSIEPDFGKVGKHLTESMSE
jgi:hypothetical protein